MSSIPSVTLEVEDTKGVFRSPKSKKDRQHNGQNKKDKQRSTKHYTINTNPTKTGVYSGALGGYVLVIVG
jgi:hypothetical protein